MLLGMRDHLRGLQQEDLTSNSSTSPEEQKETSAIKRPSIVECFKGMTEYCIPTLVSYLPKAVNVLDLSTILNDEWKEWWCCWYCWLFGAWVSSLENNNSFEFEAPDTLQHCIRWIDTVWKEYSGPESLEDLWQEVAHRTERPFLGMGLVGLRPNAPFVIDLDNLSFTELFTDIQAYRVHLKQQHASSHGQPQSIPSSSPPLCMEVHREPTSSAPPNPNRRVETLDTVLRPTEILPRLSPTKMMEPKKATTASSKFSYWHWFWKRNTPTRVARPYSVAPLLYALPPQSRNYPQTRLLPERNNSSYLPKFGEYAENDSSIVNDFLHYVRQHHSTDIAVRAELSQMMHSIVSLEVRQAAVYVE
jgi:hypothetical protein